jgi:hypothetical protein
MTRSGDSNPLSRLRDRRSRLEPAWETASGDLDINVLEREIRKTFEQLCRTLSGLIEHVDDLPCEMITRFRGPGRRQARAIVQARRIYEPAVAFLADADRIRALEGVEFVQEATDAMRATYDHQREVSEADENEVIAEARAIKEAKRRPRRWHLPRS